MLIKNYLLWVKIFFLSPFIISFLFIRIFLKIKIGMIESSIFGHMLSPIEIFLCEKYEKKLIDTDLVLWFPQKKITNNYILDKWKKKIIILPRHILEPIYIFFSFFKFSNKFNYFVNEKNPNGEIKIEPGKKIDEYNLLAKYKPFITFSKYEVNKAKVILEKKNINLDDDIVCFTARSTHFKNEKTETSRNSNILNQLKGIKYLTTRGYKAARLGKNELVELKKENQNIIDFSFSKDRSDFIDCFLVSKCKFFISASSGINEMATIMRKKKLVIDFIDFDNFYAQNPNTIPIILPKKIFSKKTNKLISYQNIFKRNFKTEINNLQSLKNSELLLVDNTEDEIEKAIINMYRFINNELDLESHKKTQEKFWKNFEKYYYHQPKNTILCPDFYEQNKDILVN